MPNAVTDNTQARRYELTTDGGPAFVSYRDAPGMRFLYHAEVPQCLSGHGLGSELAKGTLELVRTQGFKIAPQCPFIADYIRKHPEYADLVAR